MRVEFIKDKARLELPEIERRMPSITGATRLETQPTTVGMLAGLRAELADPLWLLARQWQFNEFQGEDAGTPLEVSFAVKGTRIDRFRPGPDEAGRRWHTLDEPGGTAIDNAPIETRVEAEPVWKTHPRLRGMAGLQALRMASPALRKALLREYPLSIEDPVDEAADPQGVIWKGLFSGRTVDAQALAKDLKTPLDDSGALTTLPENLTLSTTEARAAMKSLGAWLTWFKSLVYEGSPKESSWQPDRMEYAFSLGAGGLSLRAAEYTDGHFDWDDLRLRSEGPETRLKEWEFAVKSRHPSMVVYPGMPAQRYWEFEDGSVNYAGAEAGVTDLLRLVVSEFALTFGNDWFLVPVRLPVGWLYRVARMRVKDTFGVETPDVRSIAETAGTDWTLYEVTPEAGGQQDAPSRAQGAVLIPDSLVHVQEGVVLEETVLARDEMANLAWAIERKVQGASGDPMDRSMEAQGLAFQQQVEFGAQPTSAQLAYRLATPVPANWIPLLPVRNGVDMRNPFAIRLARTGMRRFYPLADYVPDAYRPEYKAFLARLAKQPTFIDPLPGQNPLGYAFYPRGWLLRQDPASEGTPEPLLIEEEEVPRTGVRLRRKFQYARSSDGRSWLWIGRNKVAGRGEAASNLRFDIAVKIAPGT